MDEYKALSRTKTAPIGTVRSVRKHAVRNMMSIPAGKMTPLAVIPLLREDRVRRARVSFDFESMETAEILMNSIIVNLKAYLVPNLAFERFSGMDELNRSYNKVPRVEGEPVVPYVETAPMGTPTAEEIHRYLGKHAKEGTPVNQAYIEAYNAIWNFRAANRSPDLTKRARLDKTLAPAFWQHSQFAHIVPDFDQAKMDGNVALNVVNSKLPVTGLAMTGTVTQAGTSGTYRETGGNTTWPTGGSAAPAELRVRTDGVGGASSATARPQIFAEMEANGITVSLANIELAKKTQAFASLRQQYAGHTDDYIIDMLMNGLNIPDQMWKQPILLYDNDTVFGMAKRYASDGGNLTESVTNGVTGLDMSFVVPNCPTGGVIMIVCEILPEQLFERQKDPYFHLDDVEKLPAYLKDELDPEKVEPVRNDDIDIDHDDADGLFGYEPLNAKWAHMHPCIGGKFYRPLVDAPFDEDRQRLWAVETPNPSLSTDFYIATNIHTKPFVVTTEDPFEVVALGEVDIEGLTVFGGHLVEASDDYDKVMAKVDQTRIDKENPIP